MRPARPLPALLAVLLFGSLLAACNTDLQLSPDGYLCDDGGRCPDGFDCVSGACRPSSADSCPGGEGCPGPGGPQNLCLDVRCAQAPLATCVDAHTLRVYADKGTCNEATGACDFAHGDVTCGGGCIDGACVGEPCAGVACVTPPAPTCVDGATLRSYAQTGTCAATTGKCEYVSAEVVCLNGCVNGACVEQDLCEETLCESPPSPQCVPGALRVYDVEGTCSPSTGQCAYGYTETPCASCQSGVCTLSFRQTLPLLRSPIAAIDQAPGSNGQSVLAVGPQGFVAKWDGVRWTQLTSGTNQALRAVWLASPSLGWIAGANGTLLRYDGAALSRVPLPAALANADFVGIHGESASHVLVAALDGRYLRFNGQAWTPGSLPMGEAPYRVRSVYVSPDGWERIVGACAGSAQGCMGRGCACVATSPGLNAPFVVRSDVNTPVPFTAVGPSLEPSSQGYALVGRELGTLRVDLTGNVDSIRAPSALMGQRLVGISPSAVPNGMGVYLLTSPPAGGVGELIRWVDEGNGLQMAPPSLFVYGERQSMSRNDSEGVVVADSRPTGSNILRVGPNARDVLDLAESWRSVSSAPNGDLLLMNVFGDVATRHSSGALSWHLAPTRSEVKRDLAAGEAFSLLVGDGGSMVRFADGVFTSIGGGGPENLLAVCRVSDVEWYAVGEAGSAFRFDGVALTTLSTPSGTGVLNDVHCVGPGDAVAVGADGAVLRLNGTGFMPLTATPPTLTALLSVTGGPDGSLYVSGNGTFLRYHQGTWSGLAGAPLLHSLAVVGPNEVYGASGDELLRFNGSTWSLVTKTPAALTRSDGTGRRVAYVGLDGLLLEGG